MRTTLDIEEQVLVAARAIAKDRGTSIGAALSELARRGMRPTAPTHDSGFPIFEVSPDAPPLTLDLVNEYRDAE